MTRSERTEKGPLPTPPDPSTGTDARAEAAVQQAFTLHWGRLLALLARQFRSLDVAEDSLADAFELAVEHWAPDGVPDRPEAWLLTAARRRGVDRFRRAATLHRKLPLLITEVESATEGEPEPPEEIPDERLRLIFTCCHPALVMEARIALTLRMVGGLSTAEIARAFLVTESTMAARITRAKKKIASSGIPYRVPEGDELVRRLDGVLAVLYLIFTEGHSATSGASPVRSGLCDEAIRLTRIVLGLMEPTRPDTCADPTAMLALLVLQHSRRDARMDAGGNLTLLADQDRSRWHRGEIAEAVTLLRKVATGRTESPYVLQAAIAALHATAGRAEDTDWAQIALLYERLEELTGSPVVRLNRAVAVAESAGPRAGLALMAGLDERLGDYRMLPAARADLLRRAGERDAARREYARALELAGNDTERAFLRGRLQALADPSTG